MKTRKLLPNGKVQGNYHIDAKVYDCFFRICGAEDKNIVEEAVEEAILDWIWKYRNDYPKLMPPQLLARLQAQTSQPQLPTPKTPVEAAKEELKQTLQSLVELKKKIDEYEAQYDASLGSPNEEEKSQQYGEARWEFKTKLDELRARLVDETFSKAQDAELRQQVQEAKKMLDRTKP